MKRAIPEIVLPMPEKVAISALQPAKYNPRTISAKDMADLTRSIADYGFLENIVINKDGTIIGGHQRVKACADLGMTEVLAIRLDLPEHQEKALNIALNKIRGKFDDSMLADLLRDINEAEEGILTGFDKEEMARLFFKEGNKVNRSLIEDYIIPPFSVWDAKQKYWQDRKHQWVERIGDAGEGRDENLIGNLNQLTGMVRESEMTGTSIFDPVLTEVAYTWFCPANGSIIDPFAGGTTRGIVASVLGFTYTGTDLNEQQVKANRAKAEAMHEKNAAWHHANGKDLAKYVQQPADMLLTCPPYYDLEQYTDYADDLSNAPTYQEFLQGYADVLMPTYDLLKPDAFAVVVVGNVRDKEGNYHNLVGDTVTIMQKAGFKFYNEIILATSIATASIRARRSFDKSKKVTKTHQNILFFKKGKSQKTSAAVAEIVQTGTPAIAHHDILVFKR